MILPLQVSQHEAKTKHVPILFFTVNSAKICLDEYHKNILSSSIMLTIREEKTYFLYAYTWCGGFILDVCLRYLSVFSIKHTEFSHLVNDFNPLIQRGY